MKILLKLFLAATIILFSAHFCFADGRPAILILKDSIKYQGELLVVNDSLAVVQTAAQSEATDSEETGKIVVVKISDISQLKLEENQAFTTGLLAGTAIGGASALKIMSNKSHPDNMFADLEETVQIVFAVVVGSASAGAGAVIGAFFQTEEETFTFEIDKRIIIKTTDEHERMLWKYGIQLLRESAAYPEDLPVRVQQKIEEFLKDETQ